MQIKFKVNIIDNKWVEMNDKENRKLIKTNAIF
jgi:hypothetical protein